MGRGGRRGRGRAGEPVVQGLAGEVGPGAVGGVEGADVAVEEQPEGAAAFGDDEPAPQQVEGFPGGAGVIVGAFDQGELFDATDGEDLADQALLRAEEVEQDARAGADRLGQRAQREFGQAVFGDVGHARGEQVGAAGGGGGFASAVTRLSSTETTVSVKGVSGS